MVCLLGVFLCSCVTAHAADDAAAKAKELAALRTQIQSLQSRLEANQKKKSDAESDLHDVERQISRASRVLRKIDRDLSASQKQLGDLQTKQAAQSRKLAGQRAELAAEARAAYAMGRQQQVKLLLNQEQPSAIGRMLAYFGYFSRARLAQIDDIRGTLLELDNLQASIEEKTRTLTTLHAQQKAESEQLQKKKHARKDILVRLTEELQNQGGELKRLKSDEQQLQELVSSLQELLSDIPANVSSDKPFKQLKGKLRWPTRGRLNQRFGAQRGNTGLTWQGVMIAAPEGGNVRAVSQGRVAFADWMRGFGLLLIIDHGDGYMSLYGHNQALYKEVGEWVDSGEVVATLGTSGGQSESALYFELRHKGRPINPLGWCAGKPASVSG